MDGCASSFSVDNKAACLKFSPCGVEASVVDEICFGRHGYGLRVVVLDCVVVVECIDHIMIPIFELRC